MFIRPYEKLHLYWTSPSETHALLSVFVASHRRAERFLFTLMAFVGE